MRGYVKQHKQFVYKDQTSYKCVVQAELNNPRIKLSFLEVQLPKDTSLTSVQFKSGSVAWAFYSLTLD